LRYPFWCILSFVAIGIPAAAAKSPNPQDFSFEVQKEYRKAKNAAETSSITHWCTAEIASFNFKLVEEALTKAIEAEKANNVELSNAYLKKVTDLDEQSSLLAKMICKPQ